MLMLAILCHKHSRSELIEFVRRKKNRFDFDILPSPMNGTQSDQCYRSIVFCTLYSQTFITLF